MDTKVLMTIVGGDSIVFKSPSGDLGAKRDSKQPELCSAGHDRACI